MPEVKHVVKIAGPQHDANGLSDSDTDPTEAPEVHVGLVPHGPRVPRVMLATIGCK